MNVDALLKSATQVLKEAGRIARQGFGHSMIVRRKEFNDIVTEGDLKVEEYILSRLHELYPDHGVVSEEAGKRADDAEYVWILDPIDGTKYYSRGVPLYSISLALEERGELILGVVFNPEAGQMFRGAKGKGAHLNNRRIHCSHTTELQEATICLEIPSRDSPAGERRQALKGMGDLMDHVRRVRILGVSALGLAFCAAGAFDAYVNLGSTSQHHDTAAGHAILSEAGGQFSCVGPGAVAGPPRLCEQLFDLLDLKDKG